MMDLFQNLWQMGGAPTGAPTDMSQIKVQPQAMDLAGTIPQANQSLDFKQAQADYQAGQDNQALINQGLLAASRAIGGQRGQQQEQLREAPAYRGGRAPEAFNAAQLSGMRMGNADLLKQFPGLMA